MWAQSLGLVSKQGQVLKSLKKNALKKSLKTPKINTTKILYFLCCLKIYLLCEPGGLTG